MHSFETSYENPNTYTDDVNYHPSNNKVSETRPINTAKFKVNPIAPDDARRVMSISCTCSFNPS
jgi:hypothetical protein